MSSHRQLQLAFFLVHADHVLTTDNDRHPLHCSYQQLEQNVHSVKTQIRAAVLRRNPTNSNPDL